MSVEKEKPFGKVENIFRWLVILGLLFYVLPVGYLLIKNIMELIGMTDTNPSNFRKFDAHSAFEKVNTFYIHLYYRAKLFGARFIS